MAVKLWMVFEALGPTKEAVEESMADHVETLGEDEGVKVVEREEGQTEEMEDPHPNMEKGYSKVVELKAEFDSFSLAIDTVINYGPTYVQFEQPETYNLDLKEAQETLQSVANMMHKYAQMGAGGVVVSRETDESP
ncbi:MAG: hypothetical protein ABEJ56_03615 [Candidatus Nanohaloarchaea archaeon]